MLDGLDNQSETNRVDFQINTENQSASAIEDQRQSVEVVESSEPCHISHTNIPRTETIDQIISSVINAGKKTTDDGEIDKMLKKRRSAENTSNCACQVCTQTLKPVMYAYGALVCEACKKFFYHNIKKTPVIPVECEAGNYKCKITPTQRDCRGCRAKLCLQIGMSKDSKKWFFRYFR